MIEYCETHGHWDTDDHQACPMCADPVLYGPDVLANFPIELHSVVQRHGPDMVGHVCTLLGANSVLEYMASKLQHHADMMHALQTVGMAMQSLSDNLTRAQSWQGAKLQECTTDVVRAKILAQPSNGSSIIKPN